MAINPLVLEEVVLLVIVPLRNDLVKYSANRKGVGTMGRM